MTPDEVMLPMARPPRDQDKPVDQSPSLDSLAKTPNPPLPITEAQLEGVKKKAKLTIMNGVRVFGDVHDIADVNDIQEYACGHCVRWDLSIDADRAAYAELHAKMSVGAPDIIVEWQERVQDQSKLIIYMTYIELLRIAHADQLLG